MRDIRVSRSTTQNSVKLNRGELGIKSVHGVADSQTKVISRPDELTDDVNEIYFIRENVNGVPIPVSSNPGNGQTGNFAGFGYQLFSDSYNNFENPLICQRNVRTPVPNNCGGRVDEIRSPFEGHRFVQSGGIIRPHRADDSFMIRLGFKIRSQLRTNNMLIELEANQQIVQDHRQPFASQSGVIEHVTANFLVEAQNDFFTYGGKFFITTTGYASMFDITMLIIPVSSGDL